MTPRSQRSTRPGRGASGLCLAGFALLGCGDFNAKVGPLREATPGCAVAPAPSAPYAETTEGTQGCDADEAAPSACPCANDGGTDPGDP
jgi:hypothetical protein